MRWAALVTLVAAPLIAGLLGYLLIAGIFGVAALGPQSNSTIPPFSEAEIQQVIDAQFPIYWVGEQYEGLQLVDMLVQRRLPMPGGATPPTNAVQLFYGECTPTEHIGEGRSCVPPLQIRTEPYCSRRPEFMPAEIRGEEFSVRGGQAYWLEETPALPHLRIHTANVTITIIGRTKDTVLEVAGELRSQTPGLGAQTRTDMLGPVTASCDATSQQDAP